MPVIDSIAGKLPECKGVNAREDTQLIDAHAKERKGCVTQGRTTNKIAPTTNDHEGVVLYYEKWLVRYSNIMVFQTIFSGVH